MIKAKNWWKNNSETWLKKMDIWEKQEKGNSRHFLDEADFLMTKINHEMWHYDDKKKVLEVGAGNGRIISRIDADCSSIDINPKLSEYIKDKYPLVKTYTGEIINLPFKDKEFDLVFTHEVLQHIEPSEIKKACSELLRVGKEVWCMESWRDNQENGEKVSDSHCGRWNYNLKKYLPVYYDFYTDWGQLFVKAGK